MLRRTRSELQMDAKAARPLKPDLGKPAGIATNPGSWINLKRGIALTVSATLAALILTSVLPPLVADQSDRAVVNAPVSLLTAPIDGEVTLLSARAGSDVHPRIEVVNKRVDRSTLITLDGQFNDAQSRLTALRAEREGEVRFVSDLTDEIARQTTAIEERYSQQVLDLQAQIGSAGASVEEKRLVAGRQTDMVARNVAAPAMAKSAAQQYSASKYQKDSVTSKLVQKQAQLDSIRHGIFVGDDVHDIATLVQKKNDMTLDIERLSIKEAQVTSEAAVRARLILAENMRLASLEHSAVSTPDSGEVLSVGASLGRHVTAGDTLARMVDCDNSFVVAIFSYRQGGNLAPGTRVSIDAGPSGKQAGTVMEVLPKTSDKVDETYAVPFPQTERRELYVLVKPDAPLRSQTADGGPGTCDVGRWVTVTRQNGWVPSTSMLWHLASRALFWNTADAQTRPASTRFASVATTGRSH